MRWLSSRPVAGYRECTLYQNQNESMNLAPYYALSETKITYSNVKNMRFCSGLPILGSVYKF